MKPEDIADLLRQAIREKAIAPGSPLIQADLAEKFGVSRNPVREALRMLLTDGLVDMRPGDGAVVRRLTLHDLEELYELRIMLEPSMARFIIDEVRPRDVDELQAVAEDVEAQGDIHQWMLKNYEFHSLLYRLANRPRTAAVLLSLLNAVQPYSYENVETLGGRNQASTEHFDMIDAIRNRNDGLLAETMSRHLASAKDRLVEKYRNSEKIEDPIEVMFGSISANL